MKLAFIACLALFVSACDQSQPIRFKNAATYQVTTPPGAMLATPTIAPDMPSEAITPHPDRLGGGWVYDTTQALWTYYPRGRYLPEWKKAHPYQNAAAPLDPNCPAHFRMVGWFTHSDQLDRRRDSLVCMPSTLHIQWPKHPILFHARQDIIDYVKGHGGPQEP